MKQLFNEIMSLDVKSALGNDFTSLAFLIFVYEKGLIKGYKTDFDEYPLFLYRFYLDNKNLREKSSNKLINNLMHYAPSELKNYSLSSLDLIKTKIKFLKFDNNYIWLDFDMSKVEEKDLDMYKRIVQVMFRKYVDLENYWYTSTLDESEFPEENIIKSNTRLFNRAVETINYCFVCENTNINELLAIRLKNYNECKEEELYDLSNYLVICTRHTNEFDLGNLIIKKNGYPYEDGRRLLAHIDIKILKKIRKYLK